MTGKRVLVAPLDWGLGHATRCIPVIRELLELECGVFLAGSGQSLELLRNEFPALKYFILPGYNPVYPDSGSMMFKLALQAGRFVRVVLKEHHLVNQITEENKIDIVISDNRYGCYSKKIPCVFITHQIKLRAAPGWGWLGFLSNAVIQRFVNKFSLCWIPDFPGSVLTGKLSGTSDKTVRFIGPLSRFNEDATHPEIKYDVLALISGPESQRGIFEELVTRQLVDSGLSALIVRGVVDQHQERVSEKIKIVSHLNGDNLGQAIAQSRIVLSRPGYSTIMDLVKLRMKAIFVPTPGQTEQEYLAKRFTELGVAYSIDQNSFSLKNALVESEKFSGFQNYTFENTVRQELMEILKTC